MAVKNRHYLPYKGEFDARQQVIFTRRKNLKGMASLLIMPLVVRENAIGTIALAAHRRGAQAGDATAERVPALRPGGCV